MAVFEDRLEIRARMDDREYQRGAKRVNRTQEDLEKQAEAAARKATQRGSAVKRSMTEEERLRKRLSTLVERTERKAETFGKRGLARIQALRKAEIDRARAMGATQRQIEAIGRAYDRMGRQAQDAGRKQQTAQQRGGGLLAGLGGRLAAGAGALGVGLSAAGAASFLRGANELTQTLDGLAKMQVLVERNAGLAAGTLQRQERQLERLGFTTRDARENLTQLAAVLGEGVTQSEALARAARDFSGVIGASTAETLELITNAIASGRRGDLRLLLDFGGAYNSLAESIGKTTSELTQQEKAQARVNEILRRAQDVAGTYDAAIEGQGRQLEVLSQRWESLRNRIGEVIDPAVVAGLKAVNNALLIAEALASPGAGPMVAPGAGPGAAAEAGAIARRNQARARRLEQIERLNAGLPGPPGGASGGAGAGGPGGGRPATPPERFDRTQTAVLGRLFTEGRINQQRAAADFFAGVARERFAATAPGGPAVSATPGGPGDVGKLIGRGENELKREIDRAADALQDRLDRERRMIEDHNERLFRDLKFQSGQAFDAMLAGGRRFWDFWRNMGLTAMRDVFSSAVAGMLGRGGFGAGGGIGGMLGLGGGLPGAPGGTSGFAGPVALGAGATASRAGGLGGLGGMLSGGAASSALLGGGVALGASQLPLPGAVRGGLAGAAGAAGFGSAVAGVGLHKGFAALLSTGPIGAAVIGGAIGVGALIGKLVGGARKKVRSAVKSAYGVDIVDPGVLGAVTDLVKQYGDLNVGVRSPAVREMVQSYAIATAQQGTGLAPEIRSLELVQRGGQLFQAPTFAANQTFLRQSRLPVIDVNPSRPVQVVMADGGAGGAGAIARNPELVMHAGARALAAGQERRQVQRLMFDPLGV